MTGHPNRPPVDYRPVNCPACGAVDQGNATCRACVSTWLWRGISRSTVEAILDAIGDRPPEPPIGVSDVDDFVAGVEARLRDLGRPEPLDRGDAA